MNARKQEMIQEFQKSENGQEEDQTPVNFYLQDNFKEYVKEKYSTSEETLL